MERKRVIHRRPCILLTTSAPESGPSVYRRLSVIGAGCGNPAAHPQRGDACLPRDMRCAGYPEIIRFSLLQKPMGHFARVSDADGYPPPFPTALSSSSNGPAVTDAQVPCLHRNPSVALRCRSVPAILRRFRPALSHLLFVCLTPRNVTTPGPLRADPVLHAD